MKQHRSFILLAVFCIILIAAGTTVSADNNTIPVLPQAFYGSVITSAGQPVAAGAVIEARGQGIVTGVIGNPLTTTLAGQYGGPGGQSPKLLVQGSVSDGTPVTFFVGGAQAQCYDVGAASGWTDTYPFKSGEVTELNLQVGQGTVTYTYTATATATATATQTSTGSYTGGGGGGGGGGASTVGTASTGETGSTGSTTTGTGAAGASPTSTAGAATNTGSQGSGTSVTGAQTQPGQVDTVNPTPDMTTGTPPPTGMGTGQMIQPLWGIAILIVIIIIGVAAYLYSRQKPQPESQPESQQESEQKKE